MIFFVFARANHFLFQFFEATLDLIPQFFRQLLIDHGKKAILPFNMAG